MNRGKPWLGGLVAICLATLAYLLITAPAAADLVSVVHTTLEDFNAGTLFHTGLIRYDDGEVQLLVVGLAGEWITETNTSGLPALARHTAVQHNGHILVLGGRDTNKLPSKQVYYTTIMTDHNLADWQTTTPLPATNYPNGLFWHASVVVNDRVYVIGGADNSSKYGTVSFAHINPNGTLEDTWHTTTPISPSLSLLQTAVVRGRIYVIGGWDDSDTPRNEVYFATPDPVTGIITGWTRTADFAYATFGHMVAVYGGRIYVMGGTHPTTFVSPYTYYATPDLATGQIDNWTQTTNMEHNLYGGAGLGFSGQLYTTGGAKNNLTTPSNYVGSTLIGAGGSVGSWQNTSLIAPARFFHAAVHSSDGWLYVINGSDGSTPIRSINRGSTSGVGQSYAPDGTFTSAVIDLDRVNRLRELRWNATISDTIVMTITMQYRTKRSSGDDWSAWFGPYPSSAIPGTVTTTLPLNGSARYFQYQAHFGTADSHATPMLNAVRFISAIPTYDVQLTKDSVPPPASIVCPGQVISYSLTYSNSAGGITATQTYILDAPPEHTTYAPGSIYGFGHDDSNPALLRWDLGTLSPDEEGIVGYAVVVTDSLVEQTILQNSATIYSNSGADRVSNVVTHTLKIGPLELQVTKDAVPPPGNQVTPGSRITYTVYYTNAGLISASQAVLTETYDVHESYNVTFADPSPDEGNNIWQLGALAPDDHGQIQIVVQLTGTLPNHWPVTNQASLSSPESPITSSDIVTHMVIYSGIDLTDLSVEDIHWEPAEPEPNTPITFYATIVNSGTLDADKYFWAELYIKPHPSTPPLGPADHDHGYCLNNCSVLRPHYLYYVDNLAQGESKEVSFAGDDLIFPAQGTYDVYVQIDVAFDDPHYSRYWGVYAEEYEDNNIAHENATSAGPPSVYLPLICRNSP